MTSFNENWYPDEDLRALRDAYRSVKVEGDRIELGGWEGRSAIALASLSPHKLIVVDSWLVAPPYPRDVFPTFCENTRHLPNIVPVRSDVLEYLRAYTGPLAFLHVDACHDYDHVAETLRLALPRLVPGGVICGHDISHEPVRRAVSDVLGRYSATANVWTYT